MVGQIDKAFYGALISSKRDVDDSEMDDRIGRQRGPWAGNTAGLERISSLTSDARSREARQHCMLLFTRENRTEIKTLTNQGVHR